MPKKIAVIDGNSLMHRAYHAVPATMNAPDGTPTNAAFGFLSMFLKFYEMARPDAVVCAFDAGRPAFRMEALEQYKAQRPPMDAELKAQFPVIEHLLESMNVPVIRVKGWEGDDVLGTVSARDEELGYETLLVSGDKDVYQLVTDRTHVVTTKKGITDVAIYGPAEVEERYGVTPAQFPDFLGLKGDSSDNIPGVPGIGDKTAAKLLQNYGSIDGIYDNLDKLKGKQLQNLTEHKEDAYTSRRVATIVRDVEFDLDLEGVKFPDFDSAKVAEAFGEVRFNAHLAKVLALAGADESLAAPAALELPSLAPVVGDYAHDALKTAMEHDVCAWAWNSSLRRRKACLPSRTACSSACPIRCSCSRAKMPTRRLRKSCVRAISARSIASARCRKSIQSIPRKKRSSMHPRCMRRVSSTLVWPHTC